METETNSPLRSKPSENLLVKLKEKTTNKPKRLNLKRSFVHVIVTFSNVYHPFIVWGTFRREYGIIEHAKS